MPEKYRYDSSCGKLFEYDYEQNAYIFVCSNPYGLSEQQLIDEYEETLLYSQE